MNVPLKPLVEQVVVITGATSGIGLVTARKAARAGARLVLAARNQEVLQQVTDEIRAGGGETVYAVADVSQPEDVRHIARAAHDRFGGVDTWFNNVAVSNLRIARSDPAGGAPPRPRRQLLGPRLWIARRG